MDKDSKGSTNSVLPKGVIQGAPHYEGEQGSSNGNLSSLLTSVSTPPRSATILKNRSTLLAKGAMIPCVLITRIDSSVAE